MEVYDDLLPDVQSVLALADKEDTPPEMYRWANVRGLKAIADHYELAHPDEDFRYNVLLEELVFSDD